MYSLIRTHMSCAIPYIHIESNIPGGIYFTEEKYLTFLNL